MWPSVIFPILAGDDPTVGMLEQIAKAGPTVIVLVGFVLILTGRLVPGKTHDRVVSERDQLLKLALQNAQLARTSLGKLEEATQDP